MIFEEAVSPMLWLKILLFFFFFLDVEGKLLKHPYFAILISSVPVSPGNLEIKEGRFCSSRE